MSALPYLLDFAALLVVVMAAVYVHRDLLARVQPPPRVAGSRPTRTLTLPIVRGRLPGPIQLPVTSPAPGGRHRRREHTAGQR